jgi:hypothetical protein
MSQLQTLLSCEEIREILDRHPGSRGEICAAASVTRQTLHLWLDGKTTSANIQTAARAKAVALLKIEAKVSV